MLKYLSHPRALGYELIGYEALVFGFLWVAVLEKLVAPFFLEPGADINFFVLILAVIIGGLIVFVGYGVLNLYFHLVMIPAWTVVGWYSSTALIGGYPRYVAVLFLTISVYVFWNELDKAKYEVDRAGAQEQRYQKFLSDYTNGDYAIAFDLHSLREHYEFLTRIPANTPILISKEVLHGAPPHIMNALEKLQTTIDHLQFVHADQAFLNDNNLDAMNDEDRITGAYLQYQVNTSKKVIYVCEGQRTRMMARTSNIQCDTLKKTS